MRQLIIIENVEDGEIETACFFDDDCEIAHNGPFITIKDTQNITIINLTNLVGFSLVDIIAAEKRSNEHDEAIEAYNAEQVHFDCSGDCQRHCGDCVTRTAKINQEIEDENS